MENLRSNPPPGVRDRKASLRALDRAIRARGDEILAALAADLGKPATDAFLTEVFFVRGEIRHAHRHLASWCRPRRVRAGYFTWPSRDYVRREPLGRCLIVGPWNYPFQLLLAPLVAAIAAGCEATLWPSPHAPRTTEAIRDVLADAGLSARVRVEGGSDEDLLRAAEKPWDLIFYTGNGARAREIMAGAARNLCPVVLELGGKSPCVIDRGMDVDRVARRIARGKWLNAGQTCVAPDFVCVPRAERDAYVTALQRAIVDFYGPRPADSADYARIVHGGHYDRLAALRRPADGPVVVGADDRANLRLAPTLLARADWDSPAMAEEIFGPVLPVLAYDDPAALALTLAARPTPLALYAFSRDRRFVADLVDRVPSGGACVNDVLLHITNPRLPFGGKGESGTGRYHGKSGFDAFTYERSFMRRSARWSPFACDPPFGRTAALLRRFLG